MMLRLRVDNATLRLQSQKFLASLWALVNRMSVCNDCKEKSGPFSKNKNAQSTAMCGSYCIIRVTFIIQHTIFYS